MIAQPTLFDAPPSELDQRFQAFHRKHPEVYQTLRRLALDMHARGYRRTSMKMLFEVIRWDHLKSMTPDQAEDFKLNNSYSSRMARLLMETEPALAGFFETRELKS